MKALCDFLRDLALDGEHVFQIAIVFFCPDVRVGARVDQLGVYVKPGACLADAAFQHVGYAKLVTDLARVLFAAISHHAGPADDLEIGNFRQLGQKILAGTGELRLLAAKPTLLESRKTAAAALRDATSSVTTYFILPGKDLPMPSEGRVQIEQYRPHMRQVNGFNVVYWKQKDMAYLMVSGLDREGCQKLYLTTRRAF